MHGSLFAQFLYNTVYTTYFHFYLRPSVAQLSGILQPLRLLLLEMCPNSLGEHTSIESDRVGGAAGASCAGTMARRHLDLNCKTRTSPCQMLGPGYWRIGKRRCESKMPAKPASLGSSTMWLAVGFVFLSCYCMLCKFRFPHCRIILLTSVFGVFLVLNVNVSSGTGTLSLSLCVNGYNETIWRHDLYKFPNAAPLGWY